MHPPNSEYCLNLEHDVKINGCPLYVLSETWDFASPHGYNLFIEPPDFIHSVLISNLTGVFHTVVLKKFYYLGIKGNYLEFGTSGKIPNFLPMKLKWTLDYLRFPELLKSLNPESQHRKCVNTQALTGGVPRSDSSLSDSGSYTRDG